MPALIQGYEYDIFISYRQNDNRSGWVTEFVKALQEELAATIKEPVSVYFDANPHDGLLETHSVDKSLEGKLKCLIFIPILSQTYCDPKSFAWQQEFCTFNTIAKGDSLGRDIRLGGGNVASRILPVRIHELDEDDKASIESELGGVLRPIDFIFKSAGVNRPLEAHELHPHDNLNKTYYKDQVNKVANAVKELVSSMKGQRSKSTSSGLPEPSRKTKRSLFVGSAVLLLLLIAGYFNYPIIIGWLKASPDKSIAVLPFADMSPGKDMEYLGDGMAEEIINVLAQSDQLKVIARTSSFQYKGKQMDLRKVGEELGVSTVLEGSVRTANNQLRITAQLIETETGMHLWSRTFDRSPDDILQVQDEIAQAVASALRGKLLGKRDEHVRNPEVHNLSLQARYYVRNRERGYYQKADSLFRRALSIDSADAVLWADIARLNNLYAAFGSIDPRVSFSRSRKAVERALALDPSLAEAHLALAAIKRNYDKDWAGAAAEYNRVLEADPRNVNALVGKGGMERNLGHFASSLRCLRAAMQLDPMDAGRFEGIGLSLFFSDSLKQAIYYLRRAVEIQPKRQYTHAMHGIVLLKLGKYDEAKREIDAEIATAWRLFAQAQYAYMIGNVAESDRSLADLKARYGTQMAYQIASVHGVREEIDSAFLWFNAAQKFADVGLTQTKADPLLRNLHSDPRWKPMLAKLGFPED